MVDLEDFKPHLPPNYRAIFLFVIILFLGSFVFIVALAWNDLVKRIFELEDNNNTTAFIIYAVTVTISFLVIAFIVGLYFPNALKR